MLASIHMHNVDFADLYFRIRGWKAGASRGNRQAGRSASDPWRGHPGGAGRKTAFAYSDDILPLALSEAAVAVRAIGRQGGSEVAALGRIGAARIALRASRPGDLAPRRSQGHAAGAAGADGPARDPRVSQVMASLGGEFERRSHCAQRRNDRSRCAPLVLVSLTVIVEDGGRREQGYSGGGGRFD